MSVFTDPDSEVHVNDLLKGLRCLGFAWGDVDKVSDVIEKSNASDLSDSEHGPAPPRARKRAKTSEKPANVAADEVAMQALPPPTPAPAHPMRPPLETGNTIRTSQTVEPSPTRESIFGGPLFSFPNAVPSTFDTVSGGRLWISEDALSTSAAAINPTSWSATSLAQLVPPMQAHGPPPQVLAVSSSSMPSSVAPLAHPGSTQGDWTQAPPVQSIGGYSYGMHPSQEGTQAFVGGVSSQPWTSLAISASQGAPVARAGDRRTSSGASSFWFQSGS